MATEITVSCLVTVQYIDDRSSNDTVFMSIDSKLLANTLITKYLESESTTVRQTISTIISAVRGAANQSVQAINTSRDTVSDASDFLDGLLEQEFNLSLADEIKEIAIISEELDHFFDQTVLQQAFSQIPFEWQAQLTELEEKEQELREKEAQLEEIIRRRVIDAEARVKQESTSSKGLFESALQKAEKVFDQNKITRFVCSTITRFQDEFEKIRDNRDVEYVTMMFQEIIEPFQTTKMVADKNGKVTKVITSSFTEDCYQDLFLFFYKYYNELIDLYDKQQQLPTTADELDRIFRKRRKGAEQIIAQMHQNN